MSEENLHAKETLVVVNRALSTTHSHAHVPGGQDRLEGQQRPERQQVDIGSSR
jgi:hypothetical protein